MSEMLEWRERLEGAHKQMQDSEAERLLHAVDMLMLDLIEEQSRARVFSQSGRRGLTFRKATVAPASWLLSFRPRLPTRALPFGAPLDPPFKKLK